MAFQIFPIRTKHYSGIRQYKVMNDETDITELT